MSFQRIETLKVFMFTCSVFFFMFSFSYAKNEIKNGNVFIHMDGEEGKNCLICHTPGGSFIENISAPLWSNKTETNEFGTYASNNSPHQNGFPSGETKLCLGCHDGMVATEDKNVYTNSIQQIGTMEFGLSSHNSHPVSIIYNSSLAIKSGQLADPSVEPSGLGGTIEEDLLEDGKIVCTSCHDIHSMQQSEFSLSNHFNTTKKTVSLFLKISNRASALCLTCHKK